MGKSRELKKLRGLSIVILAERVVMVLRSLSRTHRDLHPVTVHLRVVLNTVIILPFYRLFILLPFRLLNCCFPQGETDLPLIMAIFLTT